MIIDRVEKSYRLKLKTMIYINIGPIETYIFR